MYRNCGTTSAELRLLTDEEWDLKQGKCRICFYAFCFYVLHFFNQGN